MVLTIDDVTSAMVAVYKLSNEMVRGGILIVHQFGDTAQLCLQVMLSLTQRRAVSLGICAVGWAWRIRRNTHELGIDEIQAVKTLRA